MVRKFETDRRKNLHTGIEFQCSTCKLRARKLCSPSCGQACQGHVTRIKVKEALPIQGRSSCSTEVYREDGRDAQVGRGVAGKAKVEKPLERIISSGMDFKVIDSYEPPSRAAPSRYVWKPWGIDCVSVLRLTDSPVLTISHPVLQPA